MRQIPILMLFCLISESFAHINIANDFNKVIGYVGPACVVVDDLFYLHGHFMRRLAPEEILSFKKYQNTLSLLRQLREAVSKGATLLNNGSISLPTPIIPEFCNGFDDTAEVVLDGCTIRANHVYIGDRVIRPINLIEKQRINAIISSFLSPVRSRRSTNSTNEPNQTETTTKKADEMSSTTTRKVDEASSTTEFPLFASKDLKEFISNAFNVNSNVTERFLPVAQMSPLFNHFVRQGEHLFEARNDDPRNYYPPNFQNNAFYDNSKAQKTARVAGNMHSATEIPHLYVDDRSMNAAAQVAGGQMANAQMTNAQMTNGQLNPYDPLILQLLQSLASRQQNVNEIIRQQKLVQQQLQQNQMPAGQTQQQPFVPQTPAGQSLKPGETMLIGGQPYMAVQLNSEPNGVPSIGLVPAPSTSSHTVTALPPIINNWMSNMPQSPQTNHYGPNAGMTFNGYGVPNFGQLPPHEAVRYHPGKRMEINSPAIPLFVNGIQLPHEICRSHLLDPFVWART